MMLEISFPEQTWSKTFPHLIPICPARWPFRNRATRDGDLIPLPLQEEKTV